MNNPFTKLALLIGAVCGLGFGLVAIAQTDKPEDSYFGLKTAREKSAIPDTIAGESTIPGVIGQLIAYGLSIIGIVFFFLIIYAGFLWMSAMGNTEKTESAKAILEAAIIGLVLVLGAYAITRFVFTGLTERSPGSSNTGSSESATQDEPCKSGEDGKVCNQNLGKICIAGSCVLTCEDKYPGGQCINVGEVTCSDVVRNGKISPNLCLGNGLIKCCHP